MNEEYHKKLETQIAKMNIQILDLEAQIQQMKEFFLDIEMDFTEEEIRKEPQSFQYAWELGRQMKEIEG